MSSSATWSSPSALRRPTPRRRPGFSGLGRSASGARALIAGFVLGLIVGLPILGWWLWPVQTDNAIPADLAPAYQEAYVAMAADSYALSGDLALAKARLGSWNPSVAATLLDDIYSTTVSSGNVVQAKRLEQLHSDLGLVAGVGDTGSEAVGDARVQSPPASGSSPLVTIALLAVGAALIGGGYVALRKTNLAAMRTRLGSFRSLRVPRPDFSAPLRRATRGRATTEVSPTPMADGDRQAVAAEEECEERSEDDQISLEAALSLIAQQIDLVEEDDAAEAELMAPLSEAMVAEEPDDRAVLGRFVTTYRHGDDEGFDTAFSLDVGEREYLGECGVGVAGTVSDSSSRQVAAMQIWLFDKSDIRSLSKLLVSDYALEDPELRETLSGRGDIIRAAAGQRFLMETARLTCAVEVMNLRYGDEPDVPPRSYFEELSLELTVSRRD